MNWQQLACPPPILSRVLWEAIAWAQMDWNGGYTNYSQFLFALDEIFECVEEGL